MSRRSITPLAIDIKCVKKLKDEIASTIFCGIQALKKFNTSGEPANKNKKQITTVIINAITWF